MTANPNTTAAGGNFGKMLTVMRREFFSRVKTRGFLIGTVLMPVFILGLFGVQIWLATATAEEIKKIGVVDASGELFAGLEKYLDATTPAGVRLFQLEKVEMRPNLEVTRKILAERVTAGDLDYYVMLDAGIYENNHAEIYGRTASDFRKHEAIEDAITRAVIDRRLARSGFDSEHIHALMKPVKLAAFKLSPEGREQKESEMKLVVAWILGFFLYMAMLLYGTIILRSVLEEKTSRVVEAVISSVKPFHLLAGKLLGVGAMGLLQFLIWATVAGVLSLYGMSLAAMFGAPAGPGMELTRIPVAVLGFFILFFVLGYFLYASLYAGVGSLVNSDQEAQHLAMPITLVFVFAFLANIYIINNPTAPASRVLSFIPFFAPITMMTRIALETVMPWEIALSLALLALMLVVCVWLSGKIFRVGVLMYGKRPTLPEVVKWLRQA
ncbi:MAG: ABC transporter permease [candidate division KSB1 bacterium]|nr:ABC transporter permease [candidate division KSB1 bacterium]MDZ7274934.1 ABC transporter permease [candidate division KSB1 bacterium]MDZ7286614.1 ABC transporter permease [candidate division KSB1 bacterium]MDZ7299222.1 ABC transporter permease [candidate division KSB1 bacterium]MDZ7308355.1 ABC transporter permease [candidate division KSB1 bacterium]